MIGIQSGAFPEKVDYNDYVCDYNFEKNLRVKFSENTLRLSINPKILAIDPQLQSRSLYAESETRGAYSLLSGCVFYGGYFYSKRRFCRISCFFITLIFLSMGIQRLVNIRQAAAEEAAVSKKILTDAKKNWSLLPCLEKIYEDTLFEYPHMDEEKKKRLRARLNIYYGETPSKEIIKKKFIKIVGAVGGLVPDKIDTSKNDYKERVDLFIRYFPGVKLELRMQAKVVCDKS